MLACRSREAAVFLLVVPLLLAFAYGWPRTNEAVYFTRGWAVVYWASGVLPLWWLNSALAWAVARVLPPGRGVSFWLLLAAVPATVFIAVGLTGAFTWRWRLFADAFLAGHEPLRSMPTRASVDWYLWMLRGAVMPTLLWLAANAMQIRLFGRTLFERAAERPAYMQPVPPIAASPLAPRGATSPPISAAPAAAVQAPLDFLTLLDRPLRGRLIAVQAQEHYVRVFAEDGAAMALLRFSDALRQLRSLPGVQVHRSYWVRADAIRQVERSNGRLTLLLSNGQRVPVSRRYSGVVLGLSVAESGLTA
jgi:hypothetical protein